MKLREMGRYENPGLLSAYTFSLQSSIGAHAGPGLGFAAASIPANQIKDNNPKEARDRPYSTSKVGISTGAVRSMEMSPDGLCIIASGEDNFIRLDEIPTVLFNTHISSDSEEIMGNSRYLSSFLQ